jgi:hypothetical protein
MAATLANSNSNICCRQTETLLVTTTSDDDYTDIMDH